MFIKYNEQMDGQIRSAPSWNSVLEWHVPNGEPLLDCMDRTKAFLRELVDDLDSCEKTGDGTSVLIVSHSFALAALLNALYESQNVESRQVPEFNLVNWNHEQDFKLMRNVSYMKIEV